MQLSSQAQGRARGSVFRIGVGANGLVAVGDAVSGEGYGSGNAFEWISSKGTDWSLVTASELFPGASITSDGVHVVARAWIYRDRLAFATSRDGRSWQTMSNGGSAEHMPTWGVAGFVVVTGDLVVVVADTQPPSGSTVWIGDASGR